MINGIIMFDGLGYVIAIGVVVLIILLFSYISSISNAFNERSSEDELVDSSPNSVEENTNERISSPQTEPEFSNKILNFEIKSKSSREWIIFAFIVIPIVNFSYYCYIEIPSSHDAGGVSLFFFLGTFVIFSAPTVVFNLLQFKESKYLLVSLFVSSLVYNGIYFPEKINLDYDNKIYSLLDKGDIKSLENEFGTECSLKDSKLDKYLWYASYRSESPIESLEFLFNCYIIDEKIDINDSEHGKYKLWSFFDKGITMNFKLNHNYEKIFITKYFPLFDDESKQKTINSLVYRVLNEYNDEIVLNYINRLSYLLKEKPEIINYINLEDINYHKLIEYRRVSVASYFLEKMPPKRDDYNLAMNILTNNLPFIIDSIKKDNSILEKTVINDIDSYFYKKKTMNLIFYSFYVSNAEVINYLMDSNLVKIEEYNYEVIIHKYNNETGLTDEIHEGCNNYLITGIADNRVLSDEDKKSILLKLKELPNICDRTVEKEINKIDEILDRYKNGNKASPQAMRGI